MAKKRVDIEVEEETLKWAAIEAANYGMSRRKYISRGFKVFRMLIESRAIDLDPFDMYDKAQQEDGYTVKRPFRGALEKNNLLEKGFTIIEE